MQRPSCAKPRVPSGVQQRNPKDDLEGPAAVDTSVPSKLVSLLFSAAQLRKHSSQPSTKPRRLRNQLPSPPRPGTGPALHGGRHIRQRAPRGCHSQAWSPTLSLATRCPRDAALRLPGMLCASAHVVNTKARARCRRGSVSPAPTLHRLWAWGAAGQHAQLPQHCGSTARWPAVRPLAGDTLPWCFCESQ